MANSATILSNSSSVPNRYYFLDFSPDYKSYLDMYIEYSAESFYSVTYVNINYSVKYSNVDSRSKFVYLNPPISGYVLFLILADRLPLPQSKALY